MSFLQPLLLAGLPLVGLPLLIHLINRQRHRTIPWAAMMFLLDAKRLTRGMARLRYWLIMAMRMLAIAGLIFAIARPLASGWVSLAIGGQPDTTIIILDRSASMEQQELPTGESKRSTALDKLAGLLETLGGTTRIVLIENTQNEAQTLESPSALLETPWTAPTATTADLPGMLQTALDHMTANKTGRTDIWICSDLRESDWNADDGRWSAIRESFERIEATRFYLLCYPQPAQDNVSVRVSNVRRRQNGTAGELVLDIELRRETQQSRPLTLPVELVINGARSVLNVEIVENELVLQGHTIPLDSQTSSGWGRVELPVDANPQDNTFYFVFSEPAEHHTTIVSDDRDVADVLRLAATAPLDPGIQYSADVLTLERVSEIDWNATSLLLWHAPLPSDVVARQVEDFVAQGRSVMFFPTATPGDGKLFEAAWQQWHQSGSDQNLSIVNWRGDSDLLAHTRSGQALPVNKLRTFRYCEMQGGTALARLDGGQTLLSRVATDGGPVYFCGTLPQAAYSNLAQEGVVFYVMIQRALMVGAATQGKARQLTVGSPPAHQLLAWQTLSESGNDTISTMRPYQAGALQLDDRYVALNRSETEDLTATLDNVALERLMSGLDFRRVEDQIGDRGSLASETWRAFVFAMALALLAEAWLCFPERKPSSQIDLTS